TRLAIPAHAGQVALIARATPTAAIAPAAQATPTQVQSLLNAWAARYGVSEAGARGVLQTLPTTRQFVEQVLVGRPLPRTVDGDIQVGVLFLRHLLHTFGGNERLALAAWYEGPELVKQGSILPVTNTFVDDVLALESRV